MLFNFNDFKSVRCISEALQLANPLISDTDAPRNFATLIATISIVLPTLILALTAFYLEDRTFFDDKSRQYILGLLSVACFFGIVASARAIDFIMDSINEQVWAKFLSCDDEEYFTSIGRYDQIVFRASIFRGAYFALSSIYALLCFLFLGLMGILFGSVVIFSLSLYSLFALVLSVAVFFQMMTQEGKGIFLVIVLCAYILIYLLLSGNANVNILLFICI